MKIENPVGYWQFGTISPDRKYTTLMPNWIWKKKKKAVLGFHIHSQQIVTDITFCRTAEQ
jgi:hypothetical protein